MMHSLHTSQEGSRTWLGFTFVPSFFLYICAIELLVLHLSNPRSYTACKQRAFSICICAIELLASDAIKTCVTLHRVTKGLILKSILKAGLDTQLNLCKEQFTASYAASC